MKKDKTKPDAGRTLYSYIRMSTRPQVKEGRDSLRRQKRYAAEFSEKYGATLDASLDLHDVKSGWTGDNVHRGRLGRFLELVREGKIAKNSILAIESFDRLSRQGIMKTLAVMTELIEAGIELVTLEDERRWNEETINNQGDFLYSVALISQANRASAEKSKWLKSAWKDKRSNAITDLKPMTAVCPSWLTFDRETKTYVKDDDKVRVVKRIFNLSKNGMGNGSLACLLNREGVPGIGRGDTWHASVVARILINRAVLGEFQPHVYVTRRKREPVGEPIKDYYPQIIDADLFNVVQYRQKRRRNAGSGRRGDVLHNLFSHIAKCGFCGGSMVSVCKDPRYRELVCDNARRGVKGCRYVSYPYPEFENSFLIYVNELDLKSVVSPPAKNNNGTAEAIERSRASIANMEFEMDNVTQAIALAKAPIPKLLQKIEDLTVNKAAEEKRLHELISKHNEESQPVKKLEDLKTLVEKARDVRGPNSNEIRLALREAIRSCVERIDVWPYEKSRLKPNLTWKEKRMVTKFGYRPTKDIQRCERGYCVEFKNLPEYRLRFVSSHPKHFALGSVVYPPKEIVGSRKLPKKAAR